MVATKKNRKDCSVCELYKITEELFYSTRNEFTSKEQLELRKRFNEWKEKNACRSTSSSAPSVEEK